MSARIRWEGLDELRAGLRTMPDRLTAEAEQIVDATGTEVQGRIEAGYPTVTGNLRKGLRKRRLSAGRFGVRVELRNTAPHALLFDVGTQLRHTDLGYNRGRMPPNHIFSREMSRGRREMYSKLKAMLVREGLLVSGDA